MGEMVRCVILPSLPTSMFTEVAEVILRVRQASLKDIVESVKDCNVVVNFIRHPPTNKILSDVLPSFVMGVEYKIFAHDKIFVIGLKFRTPVSGQDVNVTPDDLLILAVDVLSVKT